MARQEIAIGTIADDGTGDTLRVGGGKINDNFVELYDVADDHETRIADLESVVAGSTTSSNKSASFTTVAGTKIYYVDTAGGAITATLNAAPALNEEVWIYDSTGHAAVNPISLDGNGKNISGSATVSSFIAADYGMTRIIYNGTQWLIG